MIGGIAPTWHRQAQGRRKLTEQGLQGVGTNLWWPQGGAPARPDLCSRPPPPACAAGATLPLLLLGTSTTTTTQRTPSPRVSHHGLQNLQTESAPLAAMRFRQLPCRTSLSGVPPPTPPPLTPRPRSHLPSRKVRFRVWFHVAALLCGCAPRGFCWARNNIALLAPACLPACLPACVAPATVARTRRSFL